MPGDKSRRQSLSCANCTVMEKKVEDLNQILQKTFEQNSQCQKEHKEQIDLMKLELQVLKKELETRKQETEVQRNRTAELAQQLEISRVYQKVAVSTCEDLAKEKRALRSRSCMLVGQLLTLRGALGDPDDGSSGGEAASGFRPSSRLSPTVIDAIEELMGDDAEQDDDGESSVVRPRRPSLPSINHLDDEMLNMVRNSIAIRRSRQNQDGPGEEEEEDEGEEDIYTVPDEENVFTPVSQPGPEPQQPQQPQKPQEPQNPQQPQELQEERKLPQPQEPQQPQQPQEPQEPQQPQEPQEPQGPQEERKPPQPQPQEPQQPQGPQEERKPPQPQPQEPQQPQGPQEERKPPQPQPQEPQQPQGPQEERKPPQPQPQEPQQPQGPQEERKPPQPQPRKPPVALKPVQPGTETGQPKHLQQKLSLVPETEEEEEYEIAGDADDDEEERKEETETKEENADDEFEESLIRSGSIDGMLEFLRQATQTANERNCGCVKRLNCAVTGMVQLKDSVDERKQQLIKLQEQIAELKAKAAMPPPPPRIPPPPPPPSPVIKVQRLVELKKKQKKQLAKDSNIDESLIEGLKTELKSRLKAGQGLRPVTNRAARPEPAPAKASSQADEQLRLRMEKIRRRLSQRQAPTEEPRAVFTEML